MSGLTTTISIAQGGTGATDAASALTNLGGASAAHNHAASQIVAGTLPTVRGGTGSSSSGTQGGIVYFSGPTSMASTLSPTSNPSSPAVM